MIGNIYMFSLMLLWLLGSVPRVISQPQLTRFSPRSGPTTGGARISVWGSGFELSSRCSFARLPAASVPSSFAIVHNSTYMTCTQPEISTAFQFPEGSVQNVIDFRIVTSNIQQSDVEDFLVFNLTTIRVTDLSPSTGNVMSTDNVVTFTGDGFVNTSELYCFVQELQEPAQFIDDQTVSCRLPSFPTASLQYPQLSLNGGISGFVPAENESNQFIFSSTAPVLERAQFSSSAAQLVLTFDREVEIGTENSSNDMQSFECATIFDASTNTLLGGGATCDWQSSQQCVIIIQLPSTSTIMPGDNITLSGNSIRTRGVEYSGLSVNSVVIPSPDGPQPVAILESPGIIPPCGNLTLVARNSLYGGGRPLLYEWSVSGITDTALYDMISAQSSSDIEIPVDMFEESEDYIFNVTVTNFLGLQDTNTVQIQKPSSPSLVVIIHGSHTRSYPVNSGNIVIEGSVDVPSCLSGVADSLTIQYSWTIADIINNVIPLESTARNNPDLWIPPLTLTLDMTYTITFSTHLMGQPSTTSNATITVTGVHPAITAAINTGYKSSFGFAENIMLDTSPSLGLLDDQTYHYSWRCGTCGLPEGFLTSTPSITLPAGSLPPGNYQFSVTIDHSSGVVESTANTIVEVTTHEVVPSVRVMLPNMWNSLSANDKIVVRASVSVPTTASVKWSTVNVQSSDYDYTPVDGTFANTPTNYSAFSRNSVPTLADNVESSSILVTSSEGDDTGNEISLTINPFVLRPGVSYRLRLNATTEDGNSSITEFDIMTASQPTSGRLTVTPTTGTPLDTVFTISGVDWTDDFGDPPLLYQFGFRLSAESTKIYWLTSIRASSQIKCILPIAIGGITLVVRVYDNSAAYITYELPFNGVMTTNSEYDALSLLTSVQEQVTQDGRVIQGLASLMAIAISMNKFGSRFTNEDTFRTTAIDFLLTMSSQVAPTKPSLNQILFLMEQVMSEMNFDITIQTPVVTFLEYTVNQYNSYQEGNTFSTPGLNTDEASAVFTLYGRMLGNSSTRLQSNQITTSYVRILDKLEYGVCCQLGLNEEVVLIEESFGSLKLSRYTPAHQFTATCDSGVNDMCPFSQQGTVDIDFGTTLFSQYISWQCEAGSSLCSGVCLASVQRQRDIFWDGNPYLPHIKSPSLSVLVINPRDGSIETVDSLAEPIQFSFPFTTSNSTTQCVFWNVRLARWSSEGCNTRMEADRILCSCDHLTEFTVLAVCPSGYYGDQCQLTCPADRYGNECANSCTCVNGACSPVDGACDCNPGYTGSTCNTECHDGHYGDDCLQQCGCMNGADCDHVDGSCQCTRGWTGRFCESECPTGTYGASCAQTCPCRDDTECNHITGTCDCHPGYTGGDCKQECSNGTYGEDCSRRCSCDEEGTASSTCHHINGPMCDCYPDYTGQLCQTYTIPPSSSPLPPPSSSGFPIALAIIPILILLIIVIIIVVIIAHWRWKKHRSGKMKIEPLEEGSDSKELITKPTEGEKSCNNEDGIFITRTTSLTVIVPPGAKLQDIFMESQPGAISAFKEPLEMGGKFRWQIIHIREKNKRDSTTAVTNNDTSGSQENLTTEDAEEKELALKQVPYHQGVYADPNASLRDVRDLFVETGQLELDQTAFQFLDPNSHNRLYAVEEEEVITLDSMELSARKLPRTLFIKSIPDSKESRLDFCLCGRVADFECTDCGNRGYCSVDCQQDDWHKHMLICKKQRRKKKQNKKKKKGPYQMRSPDPTLCVCGAPAEMECSQCGVQGYCSEGCQIADWDEHQLYCEPQASSKPVTPNNNESTKEEELPPKEADTTKQEGSITSIASVDDKDDTMTDKEDVMNKNDDKSESKEADKYREGSTQSLLNGDKV